MILFPINLSGHSFKKMKIMNALAVLLALVGFTMFVAGWLITFLSASGNGND